MDNHYEGALSNRDRVVTSLVAGAFAGALAKTTIAPLDRTKIYFQTTASARFSTLHVLKYLHQTYKTDGVVALWRGNSATMARIIPYAAIQFTSHEQYKRILGAEKSELLRFLSGSLAGVTAQSVTYPLDMTRARLAISPKHKYRNLTDVFKKVYRLEGGIRVFYRGYVATMLGVVPYAGCSFYTYETLKRVYKKKFGEESGGVIRLGFGAGAGVLGQSSSYPFDIVRRRLQVGSYLGEGGSGGEVNSGTKRINTFRMMRDIARSEGVIGGLYKGLSMNWIKGPVAAGISFSVFDFTQNFLRNKLMR